MGRDVSRISADVAARDRVSGAVPDVDLSDVPACRTCGAPVSVDYDAYGRFSLWCSNFKKCRACPGTTRSKDIEKCKRQWNRVNQRK